MSFIEFESGTTKENARQELRNARAELLKKAERESIKRTERLVQSQLRGDDHWMLPSISKRINEQSDSSDTVKDNNKLTKKLKKEKKKKHKKDKHHKKENKKYKSDASSDDDDDKLSSLANKEIRIKKKIKHKKHKRQSSSSSSSTNSEDDEWIEKPVQQQQQQQTTNNINSDEQRRLTRDEWMSDIIIPTYSKSTKSIDLKKNEQTTLNTYDPAKNVRELNPHWKNGGNGLPLFKKPSEHLSEPVREWKHVAKSTESNSNWRKSEYKNKSNNDDMKSSDTWKKSTPQHDRSPPSLKKSDDAHSQKHRSRSPRSPNRHLSSKKTIKRSDSSSSSTSSSSSSIVNNNNNNNSNNKELDKINENQIVENPELKLNQSDFLTDQQMNEIGAKILKANIFGNDALANELTGKLERAREYRKSLKDNALKNVRRNKGGPMIKSTRNKPTGVEKEEDEHILLTTTNSKGISRPLMGKHQKKRTAAPPNISDDRWGGRKSNSKKSNKKTIDTHNVAGERLRYFPDDDQYDIKQMFEKEKFVTAAEQDQQFMNIAGKHKNPNDDLEDVFADKVRKNIKDADAQEEQRAVRQHIEMTRVLDSCDKCHPKPKFIIAMGKTVYLSLPWHEGLQLGHCILCPIEHSLCSTQLDEDVWLEMQEFRQALTQMFGNRKEDCIFFETARYLHKRPHMQIHCIPNKNFEMAPFYFKKAIQESEREWSTNKQLLELKGGDGRNDVRRAIPKGLPYFWVHFGMDRGFAHVIEEQEQFPNDFAQEIIGGMLELNARQWRKPRAEHNIIQKVKQFADWWKPFDITINN